MTWNASTHKGGGQNDDKHVNNAEFYEIQAIRLLVHFRCF